MSHTETDVLSKQQRSDLVGSTFSDVDMPLDQESAEDVNTAAFTFVGMLAADVSSGEFDLPSWPEIVIQIRRALEDEDCCIEHVERLVGSDWWARRP